MKRKTHRGLVYGIALGFWVVAGSIRIPVGHLFSVEALGGDERPILSADGPGAASDLKAEVGCGQDNLRKGYAKLSWKIAAKPGSKQRVDLAISPNGFEQGRFEKSEPIPGDQNSLLWESLHGQAIHRWRVLTLQADGWIPSKIQMFEGPPCVADYRCQPGKTRP